MLKSNHSVTNMCHDCSQKRLFSGLFVLSSDDDNLSIFFINSFPCPLLLSILKEQVFKRISSIKVNALTWDIVDVYDGRLMSDNRDTLAFRHIIGL